MQKDDALFFDDILKILGHNKNKAHALEELTKTVFTTFTHQNTIIEDPLITRENEAKVLDALLYLQEKGLINLNSATDKSSITKKGLFIIKQL